MGEGVLDGASSPPNKERQKAKKSRRRKRRSISSDVGDNNSNNGRRTSSSTAPRPGASNTDHVDSSGIRRPRQPSNGILAGAPTPAAAGAASRSGVDVSESAGVAARAERDSAVSDVVVRLSGKKPTAGGKAFKDTSGDARADTPLDDDNDVGVVVQRETPSIVLQSPKKKKMKRKSMEEDGNVEVETSAEASAVSTGPGSIVGEAREGGVDGGAPRGDVGKDGTEMVAPGKSKMKKGRERSMEVPGEPPLGIPFALPTPGTCTHMPRRASMILLRSTV